MLKLFLLASLAALALARITSKGHVIHNYILTEKEVYEINRKATTWTADYNLVKGITREQARSKLGTFMSSPNNTETSPEPLENAFYPPISFDARVKWPNCVNYIRDQEQCGSCWAFASSEVLSDRYCIKGNKVLLSPQYMVSCDINNHSCQGGYASVAWSFLMNTGTPTDQCVSYKSGQGDAGTCPSTCDDGSPLTFYKAGLAKSFTSIRAIQLELMTNGPIHVSFIVYEDFLSYQSGIYQHIYGGVLGGHGVKLVGWGRENGLNYWICANSWSSNWGENGYFRIAFGQGGIERQGIAALPAV